MFKIIKIDSMLVNIDDLGYQIFDDCVTEHMERS